VTRLFGHEHASIETTRGERCFSVGDAPFRELGPSTSAGNGIDDDGNALRGHCHSSTTNYPTI
jgi:hypothetical protein